MKLKVMAFQRPKEIKSQAAKGPEVQDSCQEKENVRNELNFEIYYVLSSIPFSLQHHLHVNEKKMNERNSMSSNYYSLRTSEIHLFYNLQVFILY